MLPGDLAAAIDAEVAAVGARRVAEAADELSTWYRTGRPTGQLRWSSVHRAAYVATRMPATYAAAEAVLGELQTRLPGVVFDSVLDLCAGPGTLAWAAGRCLPETTTFCCVERDPGFAELGRRLAAQTIWPGGAAPEWIPAELSTRTPAAAWLQQKWALVTVSYGLGELGVEARSAVVDSAWEASREALLIVEPGTPEGFQTVLECRGRLLALGAVIAAPCTHGEPCPMRESRGWCHFSQRLARSRLHRVIKRADLGFEDEKYSYVIACRRQPSLPDNRVVGYPTPGQSGNMPGVVQRPRTGTTGDRKARPECIRCGAARRLGRRLAGYCCEPPDLKR